MKKLSIKLRITLWYFVILALISFGLLFAMLKVNKDVLTIDTKHKIEQAVTDLSKMMHIPRGGNPPRGGGFKFFDKGTHIMLVDSEGKIAGGFMPYDFAENIEFRYDETIERTYNGEKFLIYSKKAVTHEGKEISVVGVASITEKQNTLDSINSVSIIFILIIILIAALGGYLIIWRALRPIDQITRTAKSISESNNLSKRIKLGNGDDEVYRLADTFDKMLDKIEVSFEKEKQFTSDASHELRTPVAVINSECEYILDCAANFDDAKESVASIKRQSDKMSKLISELLTISRMDAESLKVNFDDVDISELLSFVCDEQEDIQNSSITLHRDIPSEIYAKADNMLIARMLINLISNAYAYGKENGNIWVSVHKDNEDIAIKVSDDGIGISKENLSKIWDRFFRADKSRTSGNNVGLGLSMVKWIVEHHSGTISINSEPDQGTEIIIKIPINQK